MPATPRSRKTRRSPPISLFPILLWVFLVLSLAISGFAGYSWMQSLQRKLPPDLTTIEDTVSDVSTSRGKYESVDQVRFRLATSGREIRYDNAFPHFEASYPCIVPGAAVEVRVDGSGELWALRCAGKTFAGETEALAARKANGKYGLYVAIGFLIGATVLAWQIAAQRRGPHRS